MTRQDDPTRLRHMLAHAEEAVALARGRPRADLDSDRTFNLALVRLLEVLGEAAARVSEDGRRSLSRVPWSDVVGLRNRLIHGYDEVDFDIVWDILQDDLPPLIEALREALGEHP